MSHATSPRDQLRLLLVQIRPDEIARSHDLVCFENSGRLQDGQLITHDLLAQPLKPALLDKVDGLVIGGSAYSVNDAVPNLASLTVMVDKAVAAGKPILGVCWGGQYLAKHFGGKVERRPDTQEVGSVTVKRTPTGAQDPLFAAMPGRFLAQESHFEMITELPTMAVRLADSPTCPVQGFVIEGQPVYGVQFHPELQAEDLVLRLKHHQDDYADLDSSIDEVVASLQASPEAHRFVARWIDRVVVPSIDKKVVTENAD
jgi:GMP synthase (glutamine-hydrolysing)